MKFISIFTKQYVKAVLALLLISNVAFAAYPDKPIRIIVNYPPGGSTDIIGRFMGVRLSDALKVPVLVENKGGASGMIGATYVVKSPNDGYTILHTASGPQAINVSLFKDIPYDPIKDFSPIILTSVPPLLMVVNASHPANNVTEFIAWAKENKGKVNFCSIGPGTPSHLAGELFQTMAGIEMTHIPYKGSGPAIIDMISGQCSVLFESALSSGPHVKGGKLKALGIGSKTRVASWPNVPTITESGLPGYEAYTWTALVAPAGTPKDVIEKLNKEAGKIIASPEYKELLNSQGALPGGGSATDLQNFTKAEIQKWGKIIRDGNIKPD
jgi:tripartite-type tricarboxylate transporter receptor subunit TctC